MAWLAVICVVATAASWLMAMICNKQYKKYGNTDSRWLEFWLAARIVFFIVAGLFVILLVLVVVLGL